MFKFKGFVNEIFFWRYYYWYLTDEGIEYFREYLNLSADVVLNMLKKVVCVLICEVEVLCGGCGGCGGFGGDCGGCGGFGGDR